MITKFDTSLRVKLALESIVQDELNTLRKFLKFRNRSYCDRSICETAIKLIRQSRFLLSKNQLI